MTDARWDRIKELHDRAIDMPPEERQAFLEQECGDDTELLQEVLELLSMDEDDDFLKPPPLYADAPSLVGRVLGHFEVVARIGRGGMGVVYRARDLDLKRDVAIKVLFKEHHLERDVARFRREAESVAKLAHPGIVPVHAVGETDDTIYFVMELVEGHDLDTEIRAQQARQSGTTTDPAPLLPAYGSRDYCKNVAAGIAGIAEALQAAHDAKVVHRDIKPSNLLIGKDGRMRLVDFGIARDESLGLNHTLTEAMGTTSYMSPEQARSLKEVIDHRTDIYSLGVVLYEALALERPFSGATNLEVVDRIIKSDPKPLRKRNPDLPVDLDTVCAHAMAKELGHRYAKAAVMGEDLRLFAAGKPIQSAPVGAVTRVMRKAIRRRDLWLPLAGAVVAASALTAGVSVLATEDLKPLLSVDVGETAEVFVRMQDLDGRFGEPKLIGTAPFEDVRVEQGYYRIVVKASDTRFGEFTRDLLAANRSVAVVGQLRDAAEATAGMASVAGGDAVTPEPGYRVGEPIQEVTVAVDEFWLDATEMSNREYRSYFEATPGAERPACWRDPYDTADDLRPVTGITYRSAQACAEFLGKRLPTRAEMIVAAGLAGDARRPSWGDQEPSEYSNINMLPPERIGESETPAQYREFTREVNAGNTQDNNNGILFLAGNVQEWTETMYRMRTDQDPRLNPNQRVFFGKSYRTLNRIILQAVATANVGYEGHLHMGFRCARSSTP